MDIRFVDVEVTSFCFLVLLLTVRSLCCRTAVDPLQALLVWGAPLAAVAQRGMLPVSFSAIFVPG